MNNFFSLDYMPLVLILCLLLIILFCCRKIKKQKSQYKLLQRELREILIEKVRLDRELASLKNAQDEKKQKWKQQNKADEEAEKRIRTHLSEYYYKRDSFMNKGESRIFYYINEALDNINILPKKERKYYHLFPQVSLFSFISQMESCSENEKELLLKIIGGKNVDFILCHCQYDANKSYYLYTPILMIEIDGVSHFSFDSYGKNSFQATKRNDQFKNALATDLNLSLLRYKLSNGKISATDKDGITAALIKFFFDYYKTEKNEYIYYYNQNGSLNESQYYNDF